MRTGKPSQIFRKKLITQAAYIACVGGEMIPASRVVLAVGHSSRAMYEALRAQGIALSSKPFAIGLRVEHPQALIDGIQYGQEYAAGQCCREQEENSICHQASYLKPLFLTATQCRFVCTTCVCIVESNVMITVAILQLPLLTRSRPKQAMQQRM